MLVFYYIYLSSIYLPIFVILLLSTRLKIVDIMALYPKIFSTCVS